MRTAAIPVQFDVNDALDQFKEVSSGQPGTIAIEIPNATVRVRITEEERILATTLLVRLRDRRVLSNQECCDGCIEQALNSIQEIRRTLVDAQTELAGRITTLSAFLELMLAPIRQFLTFAQRLDAGTAPRNEEFWRDPARRQAYFDALETLRWHLSKCVHQLATIAGGRLPTSIIEYRNGWQGGAYKPRTNEVAER